MSDFDVPSGFPARLATPLPGDPRLARLSLNQRTTAEWTLPEAIAGCEKAGVGHIGVWREPLAEVGIDAARKMLDDAGLHVSSLCRGGFFTDPATFHEALDENRRAIDEAAALNADTLVLVAGGLPRGSRDIAAARTLVSEAIAQLVPFARDRGVNLSIEPMHPIFTADRGVIATLSEALDIAEQYDPSDVGVVVDTFHVWWDPDVLSQIARAADRIVSYQVCEWITPLPADSLLSRGMMGDGHIDFETLTKAVTAAGYAGPIEVEIFNAEIWAANGDDTIATMARRYSEFVAPHA